MENQLMKFSAFTIRCVLPLAVFGMLSSAAWAQDEKTTGVATKAADKATSAPEKSKPSEVKDAKNANCPISGHPVGSMQAGSHIVYKGHKVGLCCDSCKKRFNEDPETYLKKALEEKKTVSEAKK